MQTECKELSELLAVIHGDGGHRESAVGMAEATREAIDIVLHLRRRQEWTPKAVREAEAEFKRAAKDFRGVSRGSRPIGPCGLG